MTAGYGETLCPGPVCMNTAPAGQEFCRRCFWVLPMHLRNNLQHAHGLRSRGAKTAPQAIAKAKRAALQYLLLHPRLRARAKPVPSTG